jgi:hypothetical protein
MKLVGAGLALVLFVGGFVLFSSVRKSPEVGSFDECVIAGYDLLESYPRICRTPDGRSFIEFIEEPIGESPPPFIPPNNSGGCGFENCHGLDIICGENVAEICSLEYQIGDFCRDYASCELISGDCQLVTDPTFDECVDCVEECIQEFKSQQTELFECESECRSRLD